MFTVGNILNMFNVPDFALLLCISTWSMIGNDVPTSVYMSDLCEMKLIAVGTFDKNFKQ